MKRKILLLLSFTFLLFSCVQLDNNFQHNYSDSVVEASLIQYGDTVKIKVKNISNQPITLNISGAYAILNKKVNSRLITEVQAKSESTVIKQPDIIISPNKTYVESFVALKAIVFDIFGTKNYKIKKWISEDSVNIKIPYKIGKKKFYILFY